MQYGKGINGAGRVKEVKKEHEKCKMKEISFESVLLQKYSNGYCAPLSNKEKASLNSITCESVNEKSVLKIGRYAYQQFVL